MKPAQRRQTLSRSSKGHCLKWRYGPISGSRRRRRRLRILQIERRVALVASYTQPKSAACDNNKKLREIAQYFEVHYCETNQLDQAAQAGQFFRLTSLTQYRRGARNRHRFTSRVLPPYQGYATRTVLLFSIRRFFISGTIVRIRSTRTLSGQQYLV